MTAATALVARREALGMSQKELAEVLGVLPRTLREWESIKEPAWLPPAREAQLSDLEARTRAAVADLAEDIRVNRPGIVLTWHCDQEYRSANPDADLPAAWHRMMTVRAIEAAGAPRPSIEEADAYCGDRFGKYTWAQVALHYAEHLAPRDDARLDAALLAAFTGPDAPDPQDLSTPAKLTAFKEKIAADLTPLGVTVGQLADVPAIYLTEAADLHGWCINSIDDDPEATPTL